MKEGEGAGSLNDLAGTWHQHATMLRGYGDERGAVILEALAGQLEEALREHAMEVLSLSEAAAESGYSKRRLRELLTEGKVPNQGERGRPRILRADLPLKAGRNRNGKRSVGYDPLKDARSLAGRMASG